MYQIQSDYNLSGDSYSARDRWNTVKVQYKRKNQLFSLTGVDIFTKRSSAYENTVASDVHPEGCSQCIRDNTDMLLLGVSYRLDFGEKRNGTKRSLDNEGIERGIGINCQKRVLERSKLF